MRKGIGFSRLLIAIGLLVQPAEAGERKSSSQLETQALLVAPAMARSYERPGSSSIGFFQTSDLDSTARRSAGEEKDAYEHKPLTLFRFNSKFGEVAVRPVIGKVNGAQFSLGF